MKNPVSSISLILVLFQAIIIIFMFFISIIFNIKNVVFIDIFEVLYSVTLPVTGAIFCVFLIYKDFLKTLKL